MARVKEMAKRISDDDVFPHPILDRSIGAGGKHTSAACPDYDIRRSNEDGYSRLDDVYCIVIRHQRKTFFYGTYGYVGGASVEIVLEAHS